MAELSNDGRPIRRCRYPELTVPAVLVGDGRPRLTATSMKFTPTLGKTRERSVGALAQVQRLQGTQA